MAYGFGSGVQAGLGATDYSNYLRGALAGAQMQAQGGAAIGQGIASGFGSIGGGLQQLGQYAAKGEERIRKEKSSIKSAKLLARALATNDGLPESMNYLRNAAYNKLKDLDNPYLEDSEKLAAADAINGTLRDLLGIGITSAQIAESEARTNAKGLVTTALNAYSGTPTAAAPTATPGYGADQITVTGGPRGQSINIGPLSPSPQPQVQRQDNDPFVKRDRGLAAAGANPDARTAVEDTFKNELSVLVPQAAASILQDVNSGGTGDAIPAGMSEGVYSLAIQDPRVNAAIKEARTEARANKIAQVVKDIGSGGALTGFSNLSPADQLEAVKQVRELYPKQDMEVFKFGDQTLLRIGGKITTFGDGKNNIDPDKFTEATDVVYSIARNTGIVDYSNLPQELKVAVNESFLNAMKAGGRRSVGDNFLENIQSFYSQAAESITGNIPPNALDAQQSQQPKTATTQTAATQPIDLINPAPTTPASRPGIEQGFFSPPSDSAPLSVTSITPAPTAPGEPSPGQFSSERLTAPPIETSVSATGEPRTGAADGGGGYDAVSIASKTVTGATVLEAARRGAVSVINNPSVKSSLAPARAAMRLASAKTKDVIKQFLKTSGRTTLRRAGGIAAVTVAVDDILGMGATFIANKARKSEGQELRDYNTGLIEITMEKLGELSVDPRGKQVIKGRILDEIESIQRSRVGDRDADAEKNAQIRYLLELSQMINTAGFRSGEGKKYSR
jgi:hypothetical protein